MAQAETNTIIGKNAVDSETERSPTLDGKVAEEVAKDEKQPEPSSDLGMEGSGHHLPTNLNGPVAIAKELFHRVGVDQIGAWAAALSFFGLLSLVPLLICGIAALGFLVQDPQVAAEQVQKFLVTLIPSPDAANIASDMIKNAGIVDKARDLSNVKSVASIIGIGSFVWSASRIYANAIAPMNAAFRAQETRNFFVTQLVCLGALLGTGALFLLSLLPAAGAAFLRQFSAFSHLVDPIPWWQDILLYVSGVAISALMYALIYRYLPSPTAKVTWRQAFVGGATVAVLWEALKQGFALYLRSFNGSAGYTKVYGSLGSVVIVVLWVYYSSMLLLLGAEIARLYADVKNQKAAQAPKKA